MALSAESHLPEVLRHLCRAAGLAKPEGGQQRGGRRFSAARQLLLRPLLLLGSAQQQGEVVGLELAREQGEGVAGVCFTPTAAH